MKLLALLLISSTTLAETQNASSSLTQLAPLIILAIVFYFLLIRPQQKRAKDHKSMLEALKKGDEVVTNGGILGKVEKVDDNFAELKIADNVVVKVQKQGINQKVPKGSI